MRAETHQPVLPLATRQLKRRYGPPIADQWGCTDASTPPSNPCFVKVASQSQRTDALYVSQLCTTSRAFVVPAHVISMSCTSLMAVTLGLGCEFVHSLPELLSSASRSCSASVALSQLFQPSRNATHLCICRQLVCSSLRQRLSSWVPSSSARWPRGLGRSSSSSRSSALPPAQRCSSCNTFGAAA